MSRIGAKPVAIPQNATVSVEGGVVCAKGPRGELSLRLRPEIAAKVVDGFVEVSVVGDPESGKCLHGLHRTLISNMLTGVSKGFSKELEMQGVGYKAAVQGNKLMLSRGPSASPIEYELPAGVKATVKDATAIEVSGPDCTVVGDVAARIRSFCKPEPYKGKGIRYKGEYVQRKVGKTVA